MNVLSPFFKMTHTGGSLKMRLEDLPPEAWQIVTGGDMGGDQAYKMYSLVDVLYRATNIKAATLAALPFVVRDQRGEVVDDSMDYQDITGLIPNVYKFLYITELSLNVAGRAYWRKLPNLMGQPVELQYMAPQTITEKYSEDGAVTFRRTYGQGKFEDLQQDEVLYFWYPDFSVELGPGASPVKAALAAAGALHSVDKFVTAFFERGAIKATVLSVKGNPPKPERERLKSWWERAVGGGSKTAWASEVVNADTIAPVVVGEGLESLSNTDLTKERRQGVAMALGVPQYKLFNESINRATAEQADRDFVMQVIVPEAKMIASAINEQLMPDGWRLVFQPQRLDIFQQDEQDRAQSYLSYVQAGMPASIAAEMLGLELPEGVEYSALDAPAAAEPEAATMRNISPEVAAELSKYQTYALKRITEGGQMKQWNSVTLPESLTGALYGALQAAETVEDVYSIFADARRALEY